MRHAGSPAGDPNPQARLGAGWYPYSASSGTKSGSSSVKIKDGVSTNVLSKYNHTHGGCIIEYNAHGKSRIRLESYLRKTNFYAGVHLKEKVFKARFLVPSNM